MKAARLVDNLKGKFDRVGAMNISLHLLEPDMYIEAISGFDDRYHSLSSRQCQWLKLNFDQTLVVVKGNKKRQVKAINSISPGERLEMIYEFPKDFERFSVMNDCLFTELKYYGFTHFYVSKVKSCCPAKQLEKVQRNLENLQQDYLFCNAVSEILDDLMFQSRLGKGSITNLVHHLEMLVKKSNPGILSTLSNLRMSPQTYAHSMDVGFIYHDVYSQISGKKKNKRFFKNSHDALIGGFLHDIGKCKLPLDLVESNEHFDVQSPEMKIMQKHPELGAAILKDLSQSKPMVKLAKEHHVKVSEKCLNSYPKYIKHKNLSFESKLLAVVDTYQALVGKRRYKKRWNPHQAVNYLQNLAGSELDEQACNVFISIIGVYPIGSVVELSDKSIGFVVDHIENKPAAPLVALVKNNSGEFLERSPLINLATHSELAIKQNLDCQETLNNDPIDIFLNLKINNIET